MKTQTEKQQMCLKSGVKYFQNIKPWPNGLASRRKFATCVSFGHPLASTCDDLRGLWSSSNLDASFLPFGHPVQVDTS